MIKTKLKKVSMLILRADFDRFIRELILFGCVDVAASDDLLADTELASLLERETLELEPYNTNRDEITVFGTDYTLLITGWIPAGSVRNLLTILSGYIHAWDIEDPSVDELDKVPVKSWPKFLGNIFTGSRKPFSPLVFVEKIEGN